MILRISKRSFSPRAWLLIILSAALLITGIVMSITEVATNRVAPPASGEQPVPVEWGLSSAELLWVRNRVIMDSKLEDWIRWR